MTSGRLDSILDYLEKQEIKDEEIPDFILDDAREWLKEYDSLYTKNPFEDTKTPEAWVPAAVHASMMETYPQNKRSARELGNLFEVSEHLVYSRSQTLRRSDASPPFDTSTASDQRETLVSFLTEEEGDPNSDRISDLPGGISSGTPFGGIRSVDLEPLAPIVGEVEVQLSRDGFGDFEAFCSNFDWTEDERQRVLRSLGEGFADYFEFVYEGRFSMNPVSVDERLANPSAFGFGWLSLYRFEDDRALLADVARYVLALAVETIEDPEYTFPPGLLLAVGVLGRYGELQGERLESAVRLGLSQHYVAQEMQREEFLPLIEVLSDDAKEARETRASLLGKLLARARSHSNPHLPAQLFEDLLDHVNDEGLIDQLLEFILAPGLAPDLFHAPRSVKKTAARTFVRRSEDLEEAARWLHDQARAGASNDDLWAALGQGLEECYEVLPDELIQACFDTAVRQAEARTRLIFYRIAHRRFGEEILRKARADNAQSIRSWADEETG